MLKKSVVEKLNHQINLEHYASNLYLSMGAWCSSKRLDNTAQFLLTQAKEEMENLYTLFHYLNQSGATAIIRSVEGPDTAFRDISDLFEKAYDHEQFITEQISALVTLSLEERDYATFHFLQPFISKQHKNEIKIESILKKIKLIGSVENRAFLIDQRIESLLLDNLK